MILIKMITEEDLETYEDIESTEEIPDFVQQFADKCDEEEALKKKEDIKVGCIGITAIFLFTAIVFACCWHFYVQ